MTAIEISHVEVIALRKLAVINAALAQALKEPSAQREQAALTRVLMDVVDRAELAGAST